MYQDYALFIAVALALFLFLAILFIVILQYNPGSGRKKTAKTEDDDWLFHDFYLKAYGALFGSRDPDDIGLKLGIEMEKYYDSCKTTDTEPNPTLLVMHHIYGIVLLIVCTVIGILTNVIVILIGAGLFAFFMFYDQHSLNSKAEDRRDQIENELPRFLDLLKPELEIGMPIDQAIYLICSRMDDSLLAFEFSKALQESRMGNGKWDDAIIKVADKYQVDSLTDFVLDIVTSYEKGASITKSVEQQAEDVKQSHLLNIREKAAQLSNSIILPIMCLQFVPMIAFVMFPLIVMVMEGFE